MDMRADADYSDAITFSKDQVENLVEEVQVFNQTILELINKGNVENDE